MEDFRENWQTMPDEDLRKIYTGLVKTQRRLANVTWALLLPALVIYGILGWASIISMEAGGFRAMSGVSGGVLYYIAFAICGALIATAKPPKHWGMLAIVPVSAVIVEDLYGVVSMEPIVMELYLIYACARVHLVIKDIDFLKELPTFPFLGQRQDMDMSGLTREGMLKRLNSTKDGVQSVDYEKIFTADDPEEIASPPERTEDYLQQHKIQYRKRG